MQFGVPQGSVLWPVLFNIFLNNDLPLHVQTKSVDCDILANDATLHTSGKDSSQVKCTIQDCLDNVANWCNSNFMVINPMTTHYMAITTRQKHQLSPSPLDLLPDGVNIQQVTEHRHLGIIIDHKLRWDSHTDSMSKTITKRVCLLSKLRYFVDTDTRNLFLNAHIKPYIDYASVLWDGCRDALKKRLNSLNRRAGK